MTTGQSHPPDGLDLLDASAAGSANLRGLPGPAPTPRDVERMRPATDDLVEDRFGFGERRARLVDVADVMSAG